MKKLLTYLVVALLVLGINFGTARAQEGPVLGPALPDAGLTPESPFYFLDRFGEFIQELLAFDTEGKARLQIKFAGERISEIKMILETVGTEAKGLGVAESRLKVHVAEAATIIEEAMDKGEDVSAFAKEIHDNLEVQRNALEQALEEQEEILDAQEEELEIQIREALQAGDNVLVESLTGELGQVEAELELLEIKEEEQEKVLEVEEERLEEALDAEENARDAIEDTEEELADIWEEAIGKEVFLPTNTFAEFNDLFVEAKSAFAVGDFAEAERVAELAEDSLEVVEGLIYELEEGPEDAGGNNDSPENN